MEHSTLAVIASDVEPGNILTTAGHARSLGVWHTDIRSPEPIRPEVTKYNRGNEVILRHQYIREVGNSMGTDLGQARGTYERLAHMTRSDSQGLRIIPHSQLTILSQAAIPQIRTVVVTLSRTCYELGFKSRADR